VNRLTVRSDRVRPGDRFVEQRRGFAPAPLVSDVVHDVTPNGVAVVTIHEAGSSYGGWTYRADAPVTIDRPDPHELHEVSHNLLH
jgi:hypothetical protein